MIKNIAVATVAFTLFAPVGAFASAAEFLCNPDVNVCASGNMIGKKVVSEHLFDSGNGISGGGTTATSDQRIVKDYTQPRELFDGNGHFVD